MGLTLQEIDSVLDALCSPAEFWQLEPAWIPRLSDPDDEPILQMAVEAKVPIIVTRNLRHLKPAEGCETKFFVVEFSHLFYCRSICV